MPEIENTINIQLHYNFIDNEKHSINFYTRNACAVAQVGILSYIIKTLYPDENFEILSLPPKEGSFEDWIIVKFLNKNQGVIVTVAALASILLFHSQIKSNNTTADVNTLDIVEKCKNLGLDSDKIQKVEDICNAYYPKKQKNNFYESVIADKNVVSIQPTIQDGSNTFETKIEKDDFKNYVEEIPKEKEFLKTDLLGNIQLSQPFIDKQQQYGRGVAWKGVYYGDDILDENNQVIIQDGENIYFYMQDDEYKNQILNQEVSFTSGDNIGVIFDVSRYYDYVNNSFGKPTLYVKRVVSQNDNLVQHKKDLSLKKEQKKFDEKNENQSSLF